MSKVALIIGASGIGEAIALKLLKDGYTVYNGSRSPAHHERIINITVDVANEEAIRRALRIVWEAEHRIDALIYPPVSACLLLLKMWIYRMSITFFRLICSVC